MPHLIKMMDQMKVVKQVTQILEIMSHLMITRMRYLLYFSSYNLKEQLIEILLKFFSSFSFCQLEETPDTDNINNHALCVPLNFLTRPIYVYRMNDGIFSKDQPSKNCTS